MTLVDTLSGNEFFQLPLMEGMMYVAVLLLIGAGIFGIWDRLAASPSQPSESYEWRKAA